MARLAVTCVVLVGVHARLQRYRSAIQLNLIRSILLALVISSSSIKSLMTCSNEPFETYVSPPLAVIYTRRRRL